jgi:hypothetical protein
VVVLPEIVFFLHFQAAKIFNLETCVYMSQNSKVADSFGIIKFSLIFLAVEPSQVRNTAPGKVFHFCEQPHRVQGKMRRPEISDKQ